MTLADHLDMVGVTLKATWTQTRKVNGDALQQRVENTVKPWKAGKFMSITQTGWSLNSFALSKVWFRTHCVDIREQDINKIHSSAKSWLYADLFLKPAELVMFRPAYYGGLEVHNVKYKALAALTRTFLETAYNQSFQRSLFHSNLFRFHILNDRSRSTKFI